jgi:hypothetical protein
MRRIIILLAILAGQQIITSGQSVNFNDSAAVYFRETQINSLHYKDLWNIDLYGPVLLVDQVTRMIYANYPDSAGILKPDGKIFTGFLPAKINISNTSVVWGGRSWAMIMLPLPENIQERLDLLSHELFHRSQPVLGFHIFNPDNNHLDTREGRVYLRLELEALRKALVANTDADIHDHLSNALYFREIRYSLFPGSASGENELELNEGLATYTGLIMSGRNESETKKYFDQKITEFLTYPTFVRSFAYITTPIYGFLLNSSYKDWNKQITDTTNLTNFFIKAFGLTIPVKLCPECLSKYGFEKILNEETGREVEKEKQIAELKRKYIELPHLGIKFEKMNISFDPRNLVPLEGYGTYYPSMRISDNWGILTVTGGALLGTNWDKVILSEPTMIKSDTISGKGWSLYLNKGYSVERNISDGNYYLKK